MNGVEKRLWILLGVLVLGFGVVWVMPRDGVRRLSRLSQDLPEFFGIWQGKGVQVSQSELQILAKDTEFARKSYLHPLKPAVEVSIVFSGKDLNNSIHRPERCLKAQGWNFKRERYLTIEGVLPDGKSFPVKEIVCSKPALDKEGKPVMLENGKQRVDMQVQFYTFIGHEKVVEGHYGRTFTDIWARLIHGYDQQWAYATFSTVVMSNYVEQGFDMPDALKAYDLEKCEEHLKEFIKELMPLMMDQGKEEGS